MCFNGVILHLELLDNIFEMDFQWAMETGNGAPHNLSYGKKPAKPYIRPKQQRPKFGRYAYFNLPALPPSYSVLPSVYKTFGHSDASQIFPLYGNDDIKNCTVTAAAHALTVYEGIIGSQTILPENEVMDIYRQLSHGANASLGGDEVLDFWKQTGIGGEKILDFSRISFGNPDNVRRAIHMYGGIHLGFLTTVDTKTQFRDGKIWTSERLDGDAHSVYVVGYDDVGVDVLTWGAVHRATWKWWSDCVDEAYVILPVEAQVPGFSPGSNFDQIKAYLDEI